MPTDFQLKFMNGLHKGLLTVSFGKLGWRAGGMHVVELTTTGRKSGLPRTVMLTSPLQEGSTIVLVGSRGGDPTDPAWVTNLRANPEVEVVFKGGPKQKMHAEVADADERARLWPVVLADQPRYGEYQKKTTREIPLVLLQPVS